MCRFIYEYFSGFDITLFETFYPEKTSSYESHKWKISTRKSKISDICLLYFEIAFNYLNIICESC